MTANRNKHWNMNSMQHLSVFPAVFRRLLFAPGFSRWEKGMLSYKLSRLQPGFPTRFSKEHDATKAEACREAALKRAMHPCEGEPCSLRLKPGAKKCALKHAETIKRQWVASPWFPRVAQASARLVWEPIFEADLPETAYGFRPGRNAHLASAGDGPAEAALAAGAHGGGGYCTEIGLYRLPTARPADPAHA